MRWVPRSPRRRWAWARCAAGGAGAVAFVAIMATAGAGWAEPAARSAGLVRSADDVEASGVQLPASIAVTPTAPLTVLSVGGQALTCVQSPLAVDAAGLAGALAPQVGVTIIRGSAPPSPAVTWVVVPAGRLPDGATTAVTICTPSR